MPENPQRETKVKLKSELAPYVDSRQPIILAVVDEEDRFLRVEETVLTSTNRVDRVYTWDFNGKVHDRKTGQHFNCQHPREAVEWFAGEPLDEDAEKKSLKDDGPVKQSVLIMFDVMYHMQEGGNSGHSNPGLTRIIKNAQANFLKHKRNLVLVGSREVVPPELEHHVAVVKYPLPNRDFMRNLVQRGCKWFAKPEDQGKPEKWLQLSEDDEIFLATLLLGFRGSEAENILARAAHENMRKRTVDPTLDSGFDIETIRSAKVETIRSNPALRIVIPKSSSAAHTGMSMIGGAGALKSWWGSRQQFFTEEARLEGIDMPKGAILFGTGGTGKDNAVEHLAEVIGWTCLYADLGASKGPLQGQSHKGYRDIITAAETQAPCFLVLSEWEKTMAAAFSPVGGALDPTSSEIFASFLNWMQNRTAPVFVWALTNDIISIPQAALRAQRWDKILFMDLPEEWERKEIFEIHLRRTNWDHLFYKIDTQVLAERTPGYTGAEIRSVVNEAIGLKYINDGTREQGRALTTEHLLEAIELVVPSYKLKKGEIDALRDYAKAGNISRANSEKETTNEPQPVRRQKVGPALVQELL